MHLLRDGKLVKVDVPLDADVNIVRDQLVVYVRKPWTAGGATGLEADHPGAGERRGHGAHA